MNIQTRTAFDQLVPSEQAAIDLFAEARWHGTPRCACCGSTEVKPIPKKPGWFHCRCSHQTSLRSGTPLHGSRKPYRDWLFAMWACLGGRAISARRLQRVLGYGSYETAWRMLHKVRIALLPHLVPLVGEVAIGYERVGVARRASGDPPGGNSLCLAIGDDSPVWLPAVGRRRYLVVPDHPDADIDAQVAAQLADDGGCVRWADDTGLEYAVLRHCRERAWVGASDASALVRSVYGGVSRRYYPNYLAQAAELPRPGFSGTPFDAAVARVATGRRTPPSLRTDAFDLHGHA